MKTREILSIVALGLLGVCLLCGLAKMAMKGDKAKQSCDHVCSLSLFVAVVLLGVSQLVKETEKYGQTSKLTGCQTVKYDDWINAGHPDAWDSGNGCSDHKGPCGCNPPYGGPNAEPNYCEAPKQWSQKPPNKNAKPYCMSN